MSALIFCVYFLKCVHVQLYTWRITHTMRESTYDPELAFLSNGANGASVMERGWDMWCTEVWLYPLVASSWQFHHQSHSCTKWLKITRNWHNTLIIRTVIITNAQHIKDKEEGGGTWQLAYLFINCRYELSLLQAYCTEEKNWVRWNGQS